MMLDDFIFYKNIVRILMKMMNANRISVGLIQLSQLWSGKTLLKETASILNILHTGNH